MPLRRAKRPAIPLQAMRRPTRLNYIRTFSSQEFERMSRGLLPASMDEKWYIFREQAAFFFCRSWTMKCVFRLEVENRQRVYTVRHAWVDQSEYARPPLNLAYAVRILDYIIARMLLGEDADFPFPYEIQDPLDQLLFKHGMVGSGLANDEYEDADTRMGRN